MTQDWKLTVTMKDFGSGSGDAEIMDALAARLAGKFSAQFFWYNGEKPAEFTHDGKGVITSTVFDAKIQNDLPDWWGDSFPADRDFEVVVNEENGEDEIRWQFTHGRCTSCVRDGEELVEQGGAEETKGDADKATPVDVWRTCSVQFYARQGAKPDANGKYSDYIGVVDDDWLVEPDGGSFQGVYAFEDGISPSEIYSQKVVPYVDEGTSIGIAQIDFESANYSDEDYPDDEHGATLRELQDIYQLCMDESSDEEEGECLYRLGMDDDEVPWYEEEDEDGDEKEEDSSDFDMDGTTLTGYSGNDSSVSIPEGVTKIGGDAFSGCTSLASVTIPASVTEIGGRAFRDCTALASISIPAGVTKIGESAFQGCTSLPSVSIPGSVAEISDSAFKDCTALKDVRYGGTQIQWFMANGFRAIAETAVVHCSDGDAVNPKAVTEYVIPEGVTKIGRYAFSGCTSLASVTIPASVTEIGHSAFEDCTALASVNIPEGVTTIGSRAFEGCTDLASISIPADVKEIGDSAFDGCTALKEIRFCGTQTQWFLLEGYKRVSDDVAVHCSDGEGFSKAISKVLSIPEGVTEIGRYAFSGCTALASVTIPASVTAIGVNAFEGCTSLASVTIPDGVTGIGDSAFKGCTALASVSIPEGVTKIYEAAFRDCTALTSVSIPGSLPKISKLAFCDCTSLSTVTISEGVTEIDGYAFSGCTALASITIPASVAEIDDYAFSGCTAVKEVRCGGTMAQWFMLNAFRDLPEDVTVHCPDGEGITKGMTEVTIPDGVTKIALASVSIPDGVTEIGWSAFEGCAALKEIHYRGTKDQWAAVEKGGDWNLHLLAASVSCTDGGVELAQFGIEDGVLKKYFGASAAVSIPGDVTKIDDYAFQDCTSLASVTIPASVTEIGMSAFYGCTSLAKVSIPGSVKEIGQNAFEDCTALASVTIPEGVKKIGLWAFRGCTSLASVTIPESVTEIGGYAFGDCTALASITIPGSVTEIGKGAFCGCETLAEIHFTGTKEQWAAVEKSEGWNEDVPAKEVLVRKQ